MTHLLHYAVASFSLPVSVPQRNFSEWIAAQGSGLCSPLPLALLLSATDFAALPNAIADALHAAKVPIVLLQDQEDTMVALYAAMEAKIVLQGETLRRFQVEAAAIRETHEYLQNDFAALENWLTVLQVPKCTRICNVAQSHRQMTLRAGDVIKQPLSVSSRGLVAIDLHIEGDDIALTLVSPDGIRIAELSPEPRKTLKGWRRYRTQAPLSGADKDIMMSLHCIEGTATVGLGEDLPDNRFVARAPSGPQSAPLAMAVWAGLVGAPLPPLQGSMQPMPERFIAITDIPEPETLRGKVVVHEQLGALELHADAKGVGAIALRGLRLDYPCAVVAQLQVIGDTGAAVTFEATAPRAVGNGSDLYLLPNGQYGPPSIHVRMATQGQQADSDLILRIEDAKPGTSVWLWALRAGHAKG